MHLGNTCGVYTLLLLYRYLSTVINALKMPTSGDQIDIVKTDEKASLFNQIFGWATVGTGVVVGYLTGAHAYAMQIFDYVLIITANLPTFCRVGAPCVAFLMKMGKYKFEFLKGWYVVLLSFLVIEFITFNLILLIKSEITLRKIQQNIWLANTIFEIFIPFIVYFFYQVAHQNRRQFVKKVTKFFSIEQLQLFLVDFVEEVAENG